MLATEMLSGITPSFRMQYASTAVFPFTIAAEMLLKLDDPLDYNVLSASSAHNNLLALAIEIFSNGWQSQPLW